MNDEKYSGLDKKYIMTHYSLAAVVRCVAAVEAVAAVARGLEVGVEHGAAAPRPPHHHTSTPAHGDRYVMLC